VGSLKIMVFAATAAAVGLAVVGILGVAAAEAPTAMTPVQRTVSVQGVATEAIDQSASAAIATTVYRQGMADAINDGQAKAQFLAGKVSAMLGSVQSVIEDGGYIECASGDEYLGEQPDFGSPDVSGPGVSVRSVPPRAAPAVHQVKRRKRARSPSASHAVAGTCTLTTQVSLVYALS
jgi:hypothetical protein